MSKPMALEDDAKDVLKNTSRTFYPSIVSLPHGIREAVMSSYLSLRAIDEIEDHSQLTSTTKVHLLKTVGDKLRQLPDPRRSVYAQAFSTHRELPEVTLRLDEWLALAPKDVANNVRLATAVMSERMAYWVEKQWHMDSEADIDHYTFCVAGAVGLLLSDLWVWYDKTPSNKQHAVNYGRGLQAVNILRNRSEDLYRGVDFFPGGWTERHFFEYARMNLLKGDNYVNGFPYGGSAHRFCSGPQALAHATLDALERGEEKLSRSEVFRILGQVDLESAQREGEEVVLVDQYDRALGTEEKISAHLQGVLHRAFSVFILNSKDELLLQKRSPTKYHSRGLWSNTCCGHPRRNETIEQASQRRLNEEMGFDAPLTKLFDFTYRVELEGGIVEHEYDHILLGYFDGVPIPNHLEVSDWRWVDLNGLAVDLDEHPELYTYWFQISFKDFYSTIRSVRSRRHLHVHS